MHNNLLAPDLELRSRVSAESQNIVCLLEVSPLLPQSKNMHIRATAGTQLLVGGNNLCVYVCVCM